jgi:hypothetical protein
MIGISYKQEATILPLRFASSIEPIMDGGCVSVGGTSFFSNDNGVTRHMMIARLWYVWHFSLFLSPLSTLQQTDVAAQSLILFLVRCLCQYKIVVFQTANWFVVWTIFMTMANPSNLQVARR